MSWGSARRTILNSLAALGGFLAGNWIARSDKVQSLFQRFVGGSSHKDGTKDVQESPHDAEEKKRPLRDLKEYFQRKEGFRR